MANAYYTEGDVKALAACYLSLGEIRCKEPDGSPCRDCGGTARILAETAQGFKAAREAAGVPIEVSNGYRCRAHQKRLFDAEVARTRSIAVARRKVALPGTSAHEYFAAIDCLTPKGWTPQELRKVFDTALKGDCRLGLYRWGVHFDRAHLLDPNPCPAHFRKGVRW